MRKRRERIEESDRQTYTTGRAHTHNGRVESEDES